MRVALVVALALLAGGSISTSQAEDVAAFYAGKQIIFIAPTSPGGGFDLYSRMFADSVRKFIPGQPQIVVENMPGAGGLRSANYMYNLAPKDGSVIGMPLESVPLSEALQPDAAKYQSAKFSWIGRIASVTDVLGVFSSTGIASLDDARKKEVPTGATGKLGPLALNVYLCNAFLGTKFRVVLGYPSGNEVNLAMDSGEIQGRTNQWISWKTQRPQWIESHRVNFLLQIGPAVPELPNVPVFLDLVKSPTQTSVVRLLQTNQMLGRSIYAPPGIPPDRLAALREAFDKTMRDPAFLARMKTAGLDVMPLPGAALEQEIDRAMADVAQTALNFRHAAHL